ncbi:MAG TPA: presqualene diphosphate synthase HpnD [Candidatus Paceibacterota bacterium]|nr:presqualene diphosphate synthase HpnD [Verrucomicrobiota bacterium]HOX01589.1 presqualene diphosphate synthase HpnD [Verrucomicrobiota bacterium]HRZ44327.1 presqualene diphosphate synthase HpnD [Candidatus Paceibacterota bacterium]
MEVSQRITRRSASNLALAFAILPRPQRRAMTSLYAFCREIDDIADDIRLPADRRRQQLAAWREDIHAACEGLEPRLPLSRELQPAIAAYRLPWPLFDELIRGVEMDLDCSRYPDYAALDLYCYRVASVVGLLSIEIFGYRNPQCHPYAVHLGQALQLTNILRDVHNDACRGRIYLPQSELDRFHVAEDEILGGRYSGRFLDLASDIARRARGFFCQARATLPPEDRPAMAAAELMGAVYWRLLRRLEIARFQVLSPRTIRVPRATKLALIARAWLGKTIPSIAPGYGLP